MLNDYWLNTPWLQRVKLVIRALNKCDINLISINNILITTQKIKPSLIHNKKIIELYLLDMYCLNSFNKPAFCLDINEINNKGNTHIFKDIKQASLLQIDLLISSLYGDINGRHQLDYLLKWCNMNILIMRYIWNSYQLKENRMLRNVEGDIVKVRHLYLRKLDLINDINTKIQTSSNTKVLSTQNNILNTLLN